MKFILGFLASVLIAQPLFASEAEEKASYEAKMKENIEKIEDNIADLKKDVVDASGKAQARLNKEIRGLEDRRDEMKSQLNKMSAASGKAWTKMRGGLESAWSEIKRAYKEAEQEVKEARSESHYEIDDDKVQQKK